MKKAGDGFGLIEFLMVLAIIAFIVFVVIHNYYKKPSVDTETQKVVSEQGIDTSSPSSIIDSVKKKLQKLNDE